jgi:hypothetical protein
MSQYIAKVYLVYTAKDYSEACDYIAEWLREPGIENFHDWAYVKENDKYTGPRLIILNQDLDRLYHDAEKFPCDA